MSSDISFRLDSQDLDQLSNFLEYFANNNALRVGKHHTGRLGEDGKGARSISILNREFVSSFDSGFKQISGRLLEVLKSVTSRSEEVIPKFYSVKYGADEREYVITIPNLQIEEQEQEIGSKIDLPFKRRNKKRKIEEKKPIFKNLVVPFHERDMHKLVLRKKLKSENYDIISLNLKNPVNGVSMDTKILNELSVFHLKPKTISENPSLDLQFPSLEFIVKLNNDADYIVSLTGKIRYSVNIKENFEGKTFFNANVIAILNNLILGGSKQVLLKPSPTYYQLGYEFLNDWNGVAANNTSPEIYKELYGDYLKKKNLSLKQKVDDILDNIRNPSSKLFYNLLTEYSSRLTLPSKVYNFALSSVEGTQYTTHIEDSNANSVVVAGLQARLFNFQAKTLLWCLDKENVDYDFESNCVKNRQFFNIDLLRRPYMDKEASNLLNRSDESCYAYNYNYLSRKIDKISFGWIRLVHRDEDVIEYDHQILNNEDFFESLLPSNVYWFNKYTGNLISTTSLIDYLQRNYAGVLPDLTTGNINLEGSLVSSKPFKSHFFAQNLLSEEMGLGKTIELVALVLSNQRKDFKKISLNKETTASFIDDSNYVFDPILRRHVLKSKTTLIICPESILNQWVQEMNKFAPSLKILKYTGFSNFYSNLAALEKKRKENLKRKKKNNKFVVKLKLNFDKLLQCSKASSSDIFFNYSSFKKNESKNLRYLPLVGGNVNDVDLKKFSGISNVSVSRDTIENNIYELPVIHGSDITLNNNDEGQCTSNWESSNDTENIAEMLERESLKKIDPHHRRIAFELSQYDIIVASYQTITKELYYAQFNPNNRPIRSATKNANYANDDQNDIRSDGVKLSSNRLDYSSPLVFLQFWRIILDEVQMVSSQISNAAKTCKIFSRCHSWGISGTPIKKDLNDIMSYLSFLRIDPFNDSAEVGGRKYNEGKDNAWRLLTTQNGAIETSNTNPPGVDFLKFITNMAIRHDKTTVKNDINLPKQTRVLLTSTFAPVEQDNYSLIFKRFLSEAGLNVNGEPIIDDWYPNIPLMRKYLTILRKTCSYIDLPNNSVGIMGASGISGGNSNRSNYITKSMEDILERFLEEAKGEIDDLEKENVSLSIELAETYEVQHKPVEFNQLLIKNIQFIKDRLEVLNKEVSGHGPDTILKVEDYEVEMSSEKSSKTKREYLKDDNYNDDLKSTKRIRLRAWTELLHKYYFFLGNSHFQIAEKLEDEVNLTAEELSAKLSITVSAFNFKIDGVNPKIDFFDDLVDEEDLYKEIIKNEALCKYLKNKVLEHNYYKMAENIRDTLLLGHSNFALDRMESLRKLINFEYKIVTSISHKEIAPPGLKSLQYKELKIYYYKLFKVIDEFNFQTKILNEWIEEISKILASPLMKKQNNSGTDADGEEYEKTIIDQEKAFYILSILELAFRFRDALVNGINVSTLNASGTVGVGYSIYSVDTVLERPPIFDEENDVSNVGKKQIKDKENGKISEAQESEELKLFKKVLKKNIEAIKPSICRQEGSKDLNLKDLANSIKTLDTEIRTKRLTEKEIKAIEYTKQYLPSLHRKEAKAQHELKNKYLNQLNSVYNARSSYFKQLQSISDTVESTRFEKYNNLRSINPIDDIRSLPEEQLHKHMESIRNVVIKRKISVNQHKVSKLSSRCLYLDSLRDDNSGNDGNKNPEKEKMCIICQNSIINGILLECGHHYCKECLDTWMKKGKHHSCPLCKAPINKKTIYEFTYTKQNLEVGLINDGHSINSFEGEQNNYLGSSKTNKSLFYKHINDKQFNKINEMALTSPNKYGAKIDTIVKLILWLKLEKNPEEENDVQVVIFSQWEEFLKILALALQDNNIKFLGAAPRFQRGTGRKSRNQNHSLSNKIGVSDINRFKYDSTITCFLLNAQQQAAGLTLVNATHVILCEPLVNTALELQAINRIHRIGQKVETTVWMLGIKNTVEESIIDLSTKKRLDQLLKLKDNNIKDISSHYANALEDEVAKNSDIDEENVEDKQRVMDSLDMTGATDKLIDKAGGELVPVDELWESFFTKTC
ncbi:E3 ubiquitin-protein ligase [Saccharomycopsis crataegensis]|uniref:E3 ubiquitin-protein ligase n=1 Tax=Saccharomycopsis crataegensis TaxID=43959 RepID=A0AAV5QP21_9ASCO|nr:E3 ubiquitin-protein ligase [Saccharomycopsis crataegensis]